MDSNTDEKLHIQVVHTGGLSRVLHAPKGAGLDRLFTAGDDFLVRLLPTSASSSTEPQVIDDATGSVTWIDADDQYLITSSEDGCVRLYKHNGPGAEGDEGGASPTAMHALVTRTTLPIRCIALERKPGSGKSPRVAVASDELLVKVVDVADPKRVSLLTGHSKAVRAAAWSPTSPLLVTSSQDGSARVWDLSTTDPACLKVLDGIIPVARPESEFACAACWHPSGRFFVLPSKTHELVIITAPSAGANGPAWVRTGAFTVPSDVSVSAPTGDVSALSFSPNGRYLAVATSDSKVTVWETASRRPIRSEKAETLVTGLSWHPTRDALAWTDTAGQLTRWNNVCGSNHLHPAEAVPEGAPAPARKGRKPDHIDELFRGTGVDEDEDMDGADGGVEGDDLDDFVVDDDGGGYKSGLQEERRRERKGRGPRRAEEMLVSATRPQEAFQPTATPMRSQRRYLAFNMIGVIIAVDQEAQQNVAVEYHDSVARRNYRFIDHHKYTLGALGARGALYGCATDRDHPSSLFFKPGEAWGAAADWTAALPMGEDALALALTGGSASRERGADGDTGDERTQSTAIVATSRGYLRFFAESGMQEYVWAFGDQVVCLAGGKSAVLVVHRAMGGALEGHQNLMYMVIDVASYEVLQEGPLPLVKDATLSWAGFTEDDIPAVYDSTGVLYLLDRSARMRQARWIPALDTKAVPGAEGKNLRYWPVGVSRNQMMCIILKGEEQFPGFPKPLIQELDLQMPLLNLESSQGQLEEKFLRENLLARMLRDAVHAGNDPEGIGSSSSSALERSADKSLLQLIQLACKSDKHSRALDAARALHSEPTLDAAIQIAGFFHLPALAERMQNTRPIVSRRKEQEEAEAARWCSRTAGPAPGLGGAYGGAGSSRILVPASQEYGYGSPAPRTAARAFTEEFAPRSTRRSFGTGNGVSGLEGAGGRETRAPSASTSVTPAPAPAPAPAPSSSLWPEPSHLNGVGAADADASVEIDDGVGGGEESLQTLASEEESQTSLVSAIALGGGGKRKSIETDDEDSQGSAVGAMPAPPRAAKVGGNNPFAVKPNKSNPFARTSSTQSQQSPSQSQSQSQSQTAELPGKAVKLKTPFDFARPAPQAVSRR